MRYYFLSAVISFILVGCGAGFNQPYKTQDARFGEVTNQYSYIKDLPDPVQPLIASVYKFRDQTGQYRDIDNGSSFSTAVTQGATSILLKAMEDSGWFLTVERENQNNLLTERQLMRSSQQQYMAENPDAEVQPLRPLLYADILLEGGIISYDQNVITGGAGVRYFGAGVSTQYREDRVTVYLRAVSTKTGEILKTVYTSKTILSQALDGNLFRYVKLRRLLEAETGFTYNEPSQLAVTEAIEKALHGLIVEGIRDNLWASEADEAELDEFYANLDEEKAVDRDTKLLNRYMNTNNRRELSIQPGLSANQLDGDYNGANWSVGGNLAAEVFLSDYFSFQPSFTASQLDIENGFNTDYTQLNALFRYIALPYEEFTPYIEAGGSYYWPTSSSTPTEDKIHFTYNAGVEYLVKETFGVFLEGGQNIFFDDDVDAFVNGERDDYIWNVNGGVSFYFLKSNVSDNNQQQNETQ